MATTTKKAAPKKPATKTATTAKAAPQIAPRTRASKPQPGSDPEHPIYTVSKTVIEIGDETRAVLMAFVNTLLKVMEQAPAPTATAMQAAPIQLPVETLLPPAPAATVTPQQPVQQTAAEPTATGTPTLTQLREAINAYVTTDERGQKLMQVLSKYGASSASTLAEENYAAFFNDIKSLG